MGLTLYNYFRSSASYRVRIALNLKGLDYTYAPVHLTRNGGEQFSDSYRRLNPHVLVPVLKDEENSVTQSVAIMEYLDEIYPQPPLLPADPANRAHVRSLAMAVACEIHPLNNLRVLKYLSGELGLKDETKIGWVHHWINLGFEGLERELAASRERGRFCFGDTPTMADCCLIPQMFNARRFKVDLAPYPTLRAIEEACENLDAFQAARPENQPDAE